MTIAIANAPCSYGAFELTIGSDPDVPSALELLDAVEQAGYTGIDLGPVGYLGAADELRERLAQRGLSLAGGYLEFAFSDAAAVASGIEQLDRTLDVFDAAGGDGPPPRPTLADAGSPARRDAPGRAAQERSLGLDEAGWARFADGLARVVERCRARGYEPTFHHHAGTYVEAVWEIERLLACSDVGLCLDVGHLLVAGGDPLEALATWRSRINHVHVKDADRALLASVLEQRLGLEELWHRRVFGRLGDGDAGVGAFVDALAASGYAGWLVVEQDVFPDVADPGRPVRDQAANRAFLRARGL